MTRVRCATFALAATFEPCEFHEALLPHRSPHAIAQARCGPARVRTARRAAALQLAELPRHHLHRLILSHCGDRSPRSPEATRTPSGSSTGGISFLAFAKDPSTRSTRLHLAPEASGHCWPEAGNTAKALMRRALMLRHGRRAMQRTRIGLFDERPMRNIARTVHSGTGSHARPVRAALPWRMPGIGRRRSASGRKLNGGAAAHAVGCRFESGSSTTG